MKVKTNELSGVQLDWAVFEAEYGKPYEFTNAYKPSEDWAQGGSVIEQEKIGVWWATHYVDDDGQEYGNHWYAETAEGLVGDGPTPLIAAMRCYVASKLGEEVEVPNEIV